jgi:osmotically-inducible protein OsmY
MKRFSGSLGVAVLLVVFTALSACTTTQSPGEQIDDSGIHAAVKTKLTADRFSNLVNVDVNVTNGVVTLAGEVPNAKVKSEAESEARSVSGVKRVVNNLQVASPPTS